MTQSKTPPLLHLLPSLRDVAFFLPMLFILFKGGGLSAILEGDTGWHIRVGDWILANGQVPRSDFFSYTMPGQPWYAWEWLWDILFAGIHRFGGLTAVALTSLLLLSLVSLLIYKQVLARTNNFAVAILLTFLAGASSAIHWWARPHLFTLLFMVLVLPLLEREQKASSPRLWIVPVLTVLWVNLHGGFFVVLLLISAYAVGTWLEALSENPGAERMAVVKRANRFAIAGALCLAASFINPYFYRLHLHIYEYFKTDFHRNNVAEFLSVNFHEPQVLYFEILLFLSLAAAMWHATRKRFVYVILTLGFCHMGLYSARNVSLHAIVTAPIIAVAVREWFDAVMAFDVPSRLAQAIRGFEEWAAEIAPLELAPRLPLARTLASAAVVALALAPNPPERLRAEYSSKLYPVKAMSNIQPQDSDRIFTTDEWSDYLIYRYYPNLRVFVDGRTDFYGEDLCRRYTDVMRVKYDWATVLDRHQVNAIILPVDSALAGALKHVPDWNVSYDDGFAIGFRRSAALPRGIKASVVANNNDGSPSGEQTLHR